MVRERRPLCASGAGAIRLFPADPQPAHQPRKPAPARPALAGGIGALARRARGTCRLPGRSRRCSCRSNCATCSWPIASWCRRWRPTARRTACPTISTWCIWALARWAARGWCSPRWSASRRKAASRRAAPDCGRRRSATPGRASSLSCTSGRRRRSVCSLVIPDRRVRPSSAGRRSMRRCATATGS